LLTTDGGCLAGRYIISNKGGLLHPNSEVEVVGRSGPLLTVDSGGFESGGFGMVAAREATLLAVETAKKEGVALLMLRNCHHIGRVGTYAELAASHGIITTLYTNVRSASLVFRSNFVLRAVACAAVLLLDSRRLLTTNRGTKSSPSSAHSEVKKRGSRPTLTPVDFRVSPATAGRWSSILRPLRWRTAR
jgi:hypothetical protein